MDDTMKKILSHAKRRGFVFQSSESSGGIGVLLYYGTLGSVVQKNIKIESKRKAACLEKK